MRLRTRPIYPLKHGPAGPNVTHYIYTFPQHVTAEYIQHCALQDHGVELRPDAIHRALRARAELAHKLGREEMERELGEAFFDLLGFPKPRKRRARALPKLTEAARVNR